MTIVNYRKIWYGFSILLIAGSLFAVFYFGLNLGLDFTGGSLLEVEYSDSRPDISVLREELDKNGFESSQIQTTRERGVIVRSPNLSEEEHQRLLSVIGSPTEKRFHSIGPVIGQELKQKAWIAISIVVVMIILFIAYAFRGVSWPVSSWKYGLVAIVALLHDIIVPVGLFAYIGAEVDVLFVTALLAILGFSVNDTIVVFDRVRENLKLKASKDFSETVGMSLSQTIARSINTSITTLFVLGFLYFMGGEATKMFSLVLSIGVVAGTYSSIFLASPLLVTIQKLQKKK
jgi:preprotein translocase subunit SecF